MTFISLKFLVLAGISAFIYYMIPKKMRWIALLCMSVFFYIPIGKRALLIVVLTTAVAYVGALLIERVSSKPIQKIVLAGTICIIFGWLFLVKVSDFKGWNFRWIVFPIGISYYSFSLVSYLVDTYWKRCKAEHNFFKLLLFSLFFPKMAEGPISRYNNLSEQFINPQKVDYKNVCFGIQLMIYGFFKKLVVAERAGIVANTVYGDLSSCSGSIIIVGTMLASISLYADFSGYMDIGMGLSQIFGIQLERNFNHPFFSKNAAEFWRRWHITLGTWFKDYVYTPIAMSHHIKRFGKWCRKNIGKRFGNSVIKIIALSAVWLLTGLWHGTGVNYLVWGVYWGIVIIASTIFAQNIERLNQLLHIDVEAPSWKFLMMIRTFMLFCFGVCLTRISSSILVDLKIIAENVLHRFNAWALFDGTLYSLGIDKIDFNWLLLSMVVLLIVSYLQEHMSVRETISNLNAPIRWFIYCLSLLVVVMTGLYGAGYTAGISGYMRF